jgi:hypothetical protein
MGNIMKRSIIILLSTLMLTGFGLVESAWAQKQILLGERHVSDLTDKDTIQVGKDRGAFTGFRVKATGSAVEFKHVVIHFENGSEQVFAKNRLLGKGETSRKIDLRGGARYVDKVVFYYEARSKGWKGADIKLFGVR